MQEMCDAIVHIDARRRRTFMAATSPVESGIANTGPFPFVLVVLSASVRSPSDLTTKDCSAPSVFSFVALAWNEENEGKKRWVYAH